MSDPRVGLGYKVEASVQGPFEVMPAARAGDGSDGGTLDRGIVAHTETGMPVVIGEIWAAGVGPGGSKVRLDASAVANDIVRRLNATPARDEAAGILGPGKMRQLEDAGLSVVRAEGLAEPMVCRECGEPGHHMDDCPRICERCFVFDGHEPDCPDLADGGMNR